MNPKPLPPMKTPLFAASTVLLGLGSALIVGGVQASQAGDKAGAGALWGHGTSALLLSALALSGGAAWNRRCLKN